MFLGHELPITRAAPSNVTGNRERSPQGGFLPTIMRLLGRWRDRDRSSGAMPMAPDRDLAIPPWPRKRQRSQSPVPREMWI